MNYTVYNITNNLIYLIKCPLKVDNLLYVHGPKREELDYGFT